jgi:hypothetical protein
VATQDKILQKGLVASDKSEHVYNFYHNTLKAAMELLAACGLASIQEIAIDMFIRGDELVGIENKYFPNKMEGEFLNEHQHEHQLQVAVLHVNNELPAHK